MFWGLIMEPQKRYTQTVKRSFHISMAAMDLCSCTDVPVQVMCGFENKKYLLCTLQKDKILQVPLDVNFEVGDKISFITNGESHVHLTGYLNEDFNLDDEDMEEEEEDDNVEQELNVSQSNIVSGKRAKKMCSTSLQPPTKKSKTMQLLDSVNSQDDDDSDDSDVNLSDILNEDDEDEDESNVQEEGEEDDDEEGDEEEDDEDGGEEEDDDDEEEGEEEDDDDDDDDDDEEEEDVKPKMNGTAKDAKKNKVAEATGKKQKEQVKQEKNQQQQQQQEKGDKKQQKEVAQKKKIEGGVLIEDIRVGNGKVAQKGKTVQVYYEGRFKSSNKVFDSTTKGAGFKFRLGKQEVIKGWDAGVAGMKVGGKRRIVCPPNMAYGPKGSPPVIPPNSTLVFEVELKNVH